ncbi:MAG TPA: hypothetical protein VGP38_07145, partial [Rubrobacter sp.]|nr:hypothetical protein [Rubrobacter sp.]
MLAAETTPLPLAIKSGTVRTKEGRRAARTASWRTLRIRATAAMSVQTKPEERGLQFCKYLIGRQHGTPDEELARELGFF